VNSGVAWLGLAVGVMAAAVGVLPPCFHQDRKYLMLPGRNTGSGAGERIRLDVDCNANCFTGKTVGWLRNE